MAETTTRAYTLRLTGPEADRRSLWRSHVTFNGGVKAWGDWLLNLRGGLPASLADDEALLDVAEAEVAAHVKDLKEAITFATVRIEMEKLGLAPSAKDVQAEVRLRKAVITEDSVRKKLREARLADLHRILALSWLTPETPIAAVPRDGCVATSDDPQRGEKVVERFKNVLRHKGVKDVARWLSNCEATLRAAIRPDAAWVDRAGCFRAMPDAPSEAEAAEHLFTLMRSATEYFATTSPDDASGDKNFSTTCGNWVSRYWGEGEKSDDAHIAKRLKTLIAIDQASVVGKSGSHFLRCVVTAMGVTDVDGLDPAKRLKLICSAIGWKGRQNKTRIALEKAVAAPLVTDEMWKRLTETATAERADRKSASKTSTIPKWAGQLKDSLPRAIGMPFTEPGVRSRHFEFATMLSYAVRRVSQIHTKAKQAEHDRCEVAADRDRLTLVPDDARQWLDQFVETRSAATGAIDGYELRRRATEGWRDVVAAWQTCTTQEERVAAVRELQSDWDKAGDVQLFEALAPDDARCVWQRSAATCDASTLLDYVASHIATRRALRYKVPAYRHPDPLRSPSFIGFGNSQWSIRYSAQTAALERAKVREKLAKAKTDAQRKKLTETLSTASPLQNVSMDLWTGTAMTPTSFRWQSERLVRELGLRADDTVSTVTRVTRLGTASACGPAAAAGVFDADWNGRLQASRRDLEDLARRLDRLSLPYDDDTAWPEQLRSRLTHVRWFLSQSAKLTPTGPWLDYVAKGLPDGWDWKKGRSGFRLVRDDNKARVGRAKVGLAKLPGLRVLSVDLGLRDSAAAAVWQVMSAKDLAKATGGGTSAPDDGVHFRHTDKGHTRVYRRIGKTSWARLERQFLIRLDGEDAPARRSTPGEWSRCASLLAVHRGLSTTMPSPLPRVDALQAEVVRTCRLGLRRLSDLARAAYLIHSDQRMVMGGRTVALDQAGRVEATQDALVLLSRLACSDPADDWARKLWTRYVEPAGAPALPSRTTASRTETKKAENAFRTSLALAATRLAGSGPLFNTIQEEWSERAAEWSKELRWVRDWIVPRFSKKRLGDAAWTRVRATRKVGGLSLDRIATIRGVYELMRAFSMRPEPTNLRAGTDRIEQAAAKKLRPEFGRRVLAKMERLRENRVKQIASRIVEAALGVGSEAPTHRNGRKRPSHVIADPRFAPCHAVVVENLDEYRPDQKRTRRENRGLMNWSAKAIGKYLAEGCHLHGLHLRQVSPTYTSRQDSRTGAPGRRCDDVPLSAFSSTEPRWKWLADQLAKARVAGDAATPRQRLLVEIADAIAAGRPVRAVVRLPQDGGQVFVSADASSPCAAGIHADLNAAANIGLVALLDPDWAGSWWRLPCKPSTGELDEAKVAGSDALRAGVKLLEATGPASAVKPYVVAWSDPTDGRLTSRPWRLYGDYWADVESRVAAILSAWNLAPGSGQPDQKNLPF